MNGEVAKKFFNNANECESRTKRRRTGIKRGEAQLEVCVFEEEFDRCSKKVG